MSQSLPVFGEGRGGVFHTARRFGKKPHEKPHPAALRASTLPETGEGYHLGGIRISSASCSRVSGAAMYLNATASALTASMPTMASGSSAALG
jgi:hypothetical protein